jgi:hypothetical protein
VRENGRMVEKSGRKMYVYDGEEWKKLLITARNRHVLHKAMEYT